MHYCKYLPSKNLSQRSWIILLKIRILTKYARLLEEGFWEKLFFEKKVDNSNSSNRENENTNKICPLARGSVLRKVGF